MKYTAEITKTFTIGAGEGKQDMVIVEGDRFDIVRFHSDLSADVIIDGEQFNLDCEEFEIHMSEAA